MREKPTLGVDLDVWLDQDAGESIEIRPKLHHGGEIGFSKLELYFSDPVSLPSGEYVLRVKALSTSPSAPTSALLTLTPVLDQSGQLIAIELSRIAGWVFLALGMAVTAIGGSTKNSLKAKSLRKSPDSGTRHDEAS